MTKEPEKSPLPMTFNLIATFPVCLNFDETCSNDTETVAEIVDESVDGMILVYSNSAMEKLGFLDITDLANPTASGIIILSGEPTSVAVLGKYTLVGVNASPNYVNPFDKLYSAMKLMGILKVVRVDDRSYLTAFPG